MNMQHAKLNKVRREPPCQRRFHRLTAPLWASVNGITYRISNWSLGGCLLEQTPQDFVPGRELSLQLSLSFHGYEISLPVMARVVRYTGENDHTGSASVEFIELSERGRLLLEHFAKSLIEGRMTVLEDTIKHLDMPVTAVSAKATPVAAAAKPTLSPAHKQTQRFAVGIGYGLAAVGLVLVAVVASYSSIFELLVETAVVSAPMESILSPATGVVEDLRATDGSFLRKGQKIATIANIEVIEELQMAQLEVDSAAKALKEIQASANGETNTVAGNVTALNQALIASAQAKVRSLEQQVSVAGRARARLQQLSADQIYTQVATDEAETRYSRAVSDLRSAKADLLIAQQEALPGSAGHGANMQTAAFAAQQRLDDAKGRLAILENKAARMSVTVPYDGRIAKSFKSEGNTVKEASPVVLFERIDAMGIDAYLSPEEASYVRIGDTALVYVPALGEKYQAKVTQIDRVSDADADSRSGLNWKLPADRTTLVQLSFVGVRGDELASRLKSGLPVVAKFQSNLLPTAGLRFLSHNFTTPEREVTLANIGGQSDARTD